MQNITGRNDGRTAADVGGYRNDGDCDIFRCRSVYVFFRIFIMRKLYDYEASPAMHLHSTTYSIH